MHKRLPNAGDDLPALLVLASTYPRWLGDSEPGFIHELAKRLTHRFRVTVLGPHAPGAKTKETLDGVEIIRYRYAPIRLETLVNHGGIVTNLRESRWKVLLLPSFVLMQAWWVWRLTRTRSIDVIHAHWILPQGLLAALLRLAPGRTVPFVVTSHGADLFALNHPWLQAVKRFVLRTADSTTVVSGAMYKHIARIGGETARAKVMPMGVDLSHFRPDTNVLRSNRELLFVGRLVEKKGLKYLIEALSIVRESIPDVRLTIAGFGPEEPHLKQQARELGLDSNVSFMGAVPQDALPILYRRAALFVAPFVRAHSGDQEGLGLVVVEALGCDCPVLVGDVPAAYEILGDQFCHLAVDSRNIDSLSRKLERALVDPDSMRKSAGKLRESVIERFGWAAVASGYAQLLFDVVRQRDAAI